MEPKQTISWKVVPNKVSERMVDSSLIHKLVPKGKIRRRTKVLNNMFKLIHSIPSYSHYVEIKTDVLKQMSDDSDTDIETILGDEDFKRSYSNSIAEYNKSMSICNIETTSSQSTREGQCHSSYEDCNNIYKIETSRYNSSVYIVTTIPNAPTRVQPKRKICQQNTTDENIPVVNNGILNNLVNEKKEKKHVNKNIVKKRTQKRVVVKKPKLGKITAKRSKQQKNQTNMKDVQVRDLDHENLGWQTIVKRKHMPRSIVLTNNKYQIHSNKSDTLNDVSCPSTSKQGIQPSTSGEAYGNNKENICVQKKTLKNITTKTNSKSGNLLTRNKSKALNVKKNLITMWENLTSHSPSYVKPSVNNVRTKNKGKDLQNSEPIPAIEQEATKISDLLVNHEELIHHPKDSGIDDDSQEESGDGAVSASSTKESTIFPVQEELVNGNISGLEEDENNEELQDPLKLDNLGENENTVIYDFDQHQNQPSSETESFDPLGGIPDNSITFTGSARKRLESDDSAKPIVMHMEIVNKKYKIVPTQPLKETNLKEQRSKAVLVNSSKPLDGIISTCQLPIPSKGAESSESHSGQESLMGDQVYKQSPSCTYSGSRRRSKGSSSSRYSTRSTNSRISHNSNSSSKSNIQKLEYYSDNENVKSSQEFQSTKSSKLSECSQLFDNVKDSMSSVCKNFNRSRSPHPSENLAYSDILMPSRTLQNIETTEYDATKKESVNSDCCMSLNNSMSSVSLNSNKRFASSHYSKNCRHNKKFRCDTDSDCLKDTKNSNTPMHHKKLTCETLASSRTLQTPENPQILKTSKYTEKVQECNRIQQLVTHESPPATIRSGLHCESQESESEYIAWIEDDEEDEDNESNIMSPTTTRRLQQLKRLNLTTGSDSDSSEDGTESFHLQYPVLQDDSEFEIKSEKKEESNSDNETKEDIPNLSQTMNINNQEHSKELRNNDWVDATVCQGSRPDASSTIDRQKRRSKKYKRNLAEDETISHFSPIAPINSSNSHKVVKSPSPTFEDRCDAFLPSLAIQSHAYRNKSSLPLKKRPTSLGASTATPTDEDSLRYVLNTLKSKNILEDGIIDCTEELEYTENDSSIPETSMRGGKFPDKRPHNLQQLIDREELEEMVSDSFFKLKDISDDDEVFVLNIPKTIDLNNLQGMGIVMKKHTLKIGMNKYEATFKNAEPMSCVIKTGKKRKIYKTVNIKPTGSIIVRGRIPYTTSLNTTQVKTEVDCNVDDTTPVKKKKKKVKVKRERHDSATEEIFMANNTKRLKSHSNDETE